MPSAQGGGTAEGLVTSRLVSRSGSRCRTTTPTRQQPADMSAGPWTRRCPASYPWCIVVLVVAGTTQQLRHEAFQSSPLRHAARPGDPRRVVVRIEVSGDEAHLIVGRHAEVYGVIVGIRPLAREAYALARPYKLGLGEPPLGRVLPVGGQNELAHVVSPGILGE